jgi:LuxR family transcriptional regulator, maltose regulon positive regulatory protein
MLLGVTSATLRQVRTTFPALSSPDPVTGLAKPPRRPAGLVSRVRLMSRLSEARDVPLVVVVAPAGYGKTTVLSEWADRDPRPFAWIRLDSAHDAPASLTAAVAAALGIPGDPRTARELAAGVAARSHPFVLVLDDVHTLRSGAAFEVLHAVAEAMPAGSQLALGTRREPALGVGRLRAHRSVVELRTADLAMRRSEAADLLRAAGLPLSEHSLAVLVARTEGWPAALYLAALSLRAQPDTRSALARFGGDDHVVADYVRDELFATLSAEQVAFLVRTSVLDTLEASACDAVLDTVGSGMTLADLDRSNALLVSLDRTGERYRCHHLVREMLRAELRHTEPELEPVLHRRASDWYAAHGDTRSAIRHAVSAGDVQAAGELLWEQAADSIAHGRNDEVRDWLDALTSAEVSASAPLALVAAGSSLAAGDGEQVARWTATAARGELRPSLRAAAAILEASLARDGLTSMGLAAARAGEALAEHSPWRPMARLLEGVARHLAGDRDAAHVPLEEGARGGAAAVPNVQALCLAQLALLAIEEEDWEPAASLVLRARSKLEFPGLDGYPTMALVFAVSGLVRAQRGVVDAARDDVLTSTRLLTRIVGFPAWYEAETRVVLARATLRLGDATAARLHLAEAARAVRAASGSARLRAWVEGTQVQLDAATRAAGGAWSLTSAEVRVLQLLPTHLSYPAVAQRLQVSPNTVKTHVRAVYRKLGASSRSEAVALALALGLLDDVRAAS